MRETLPADDEAPAYYFKYIELVPRGDICAILETQRSEIPDWLSGISDEQSRFCHAPAAWSIREVVGHVNDTERVLAFRAFWFARRFDAPLPSFEQTIAAQHAGADVRAWASLLEEFRAIRGSTLAFFQHLPPDAWKRGGIASDHRFTVRALASIIAGHTIHHLGLLKQRLPG